MRVQTEPRHRIDWVHVQRDYATGRFRAAGSLDQAEAARLAALLRELVKLHNRVSSMQKLADAMARVQTLGASGIRHRRRRRWQQPTRHDERGRVAG